MSRRTSPGAGIEIFQKPGRIVVGVATQHENPRSNRLGQACDSLSGRQLNRPKWPEALNSYLDLSAAITNELPRLPRVVGADAAELESGLRRTRALGQSICTDGQGIRGRHAGERRQFSGKRSPKNHHMATPIIKAVMQSNQVTPRGAHAVRRSSRHCRPTDWRPRTDHKTGTHKLRRSTPIELIRELVKAGRQG